MPEQIKVNSLPVYTYNRLKVNNETLDAAALNVKDTSPVVPASLPKEVGYAPAQDEGVIRELFAGAREKLKALDKDEVKPNGDTSATYAESAVPTGMGGAVDLLAEKLNVKTDVYTVEEGVTVGDYLVLNYHLNDGDAVFSRQVLHIKKNASLTVIMDYHTPREAAGFLGIQTRILLEEGASLHLIKAQMLGEDYLHFDDIGGVLMTDARAHMVRMELGSVHAVNGCHMNLLGDNSVFRAETGYLCRRAQKFDINYVATQRGKNTDAEMIFRGVLQDRAVKTFRGTLDFRAGSSGSVGEEQEDTLILSPDAENRAIPVILCQEEDVEGHHGATIGQLAPEILFYFQTRGIDEEEAKRIMVRGRLLYVARMIPERHLRGHVEDYLRKTL